MEYQMGESFLLRLGFWSAIWKLGNLCRKSAISIYFSILALPHSLWKGILVELGFAIDQIADFMYTILKTLGRPATSKKDSSIGCWFIVHLVDLFYK